MVDMDPGVSLEPCADLGLLARRVVVHHQVQLLTGVGAGNLLQEHQELLVTVARLARGGDRAGRDQHDCVLRRVQVKPDHVRPWRPTPGRWRT